MIVDPAERPELLAWLAIELEPYGLRPKVVGPGSGPVLRVMTRRSDRVRFIACVPAPQARTWAWVWPFGWALVTDPGAISMIVEAMDA
jgi:hypothetical protein